MLSGLDCVPTPGRPGGAHAKASTRFLTDVSPPTSETWLDAGISMDQIARHESWASTRSWRRSSWRSNRARLPAPATSASPAPYTNTISWRSANTPLPTQNNPRVVFERLFGDSGSTDPKARRARIAQDKSVLDSVIEEVATSAGVAWPERSGQARRISGRDPRRGAAHPDGRGAERPRAADRRTSGRHSGNVRRARQADVRPAGARVPGDLTRVVTFMLGREFSGMTYPQIGVPDAHHPISHHQQEPEKIAKVAKINAYHVKKFAYLLERCAPRPTATARCSIT